MTGKFENKSVDLSKNLPNPSEIRSSDSLTSLDDNIFWTDEKGHIYWRNVSSTDTINNKISLSKENIHFILLNLLYHTLLLRILPQCLMHSNNFCIGIDISNVDKNKKLRIAAVIKTSVQQSPCLEKNNGNCEHLCLGSLNGSHVS